jgi:hypothetical protein
VAGGERWWEDKRNDDVATRNNGNAQQTMFAQLAESALARGYIVGIFIVYI